MKKKTEYKEMGWSKKTKKAICPLCKKFAELVSGWDIEPEAANLFCGLSPYWWCKPCGLVSSCSIGGDIPAGKSFGPTIKYKRKGK